MDWFWPQFDYKPVALSCDEGAGKNDYDMTESEFCDPPFWGFSDPPYRGVVEFCDPPQIRIVEICDPPHRFFSPLPCRS